MVLPQESVTLPSKPFPKTTLPVEKSHYMRAFAYTGTDHREKKFSTHRYSSLPNTIRINEQGQSILKKLRTDRYFGTESSKIDGSWHFENITTLEPSGIPTISDLMMSKSPTKYPHHIRVDLKKYPHLYQEATRFISEATW